MIRRQHVVCDFFEEAGTMREALDERFKNPYKNNIHWQYFCDPQMYAYLRAVPQTVFSKDIFNGFMRRLRQWCMENLGLAPMNLPYLHLMVNGCKLGLHSDFHNGVFGYVYSLTNWEKRKFSGGETLLMRDGVPSYKKHHVHGEVLYELIPARFNQLLVFDDRIVHGTPVVEGSMDPLEGRIAMVGHIRATSPVVDGDIKWTDARRVVLEMLPNLRERIRSYRDVQGTITFKLRVRPAGMVESISTLTDNLVTAAAGYELSESVESVRSIVQQLILGLRFPSVHGPSAIVVPVLVPIPDLSPVEFVVQHNSCPSAVREWFKVHLQDVDRLEFQGGWEGETLVVREPIGGTIRVEPREIVATFDPPMWVPSQRENFKLTLIDWAKGATIGTEAEVRA